MIFSTFSSIKTRVKTTLILTKSCFIFIILFLALFFNIGCDKKDSKNIAKNQQNKELKICSLSASATAILLNLNQKVTAIDYFSKIVVKDPALTIPIIGKGSLISFEKLVNLEVNHLILWDYQKSLIPKLNDLNIQTTVLPAFRLDDYPKIVKQLGSLTQKEPQATKLVDAFNQKIAKLKTTLNQENKKTLSKVYFELYGEYIIAGNNSYIGDLLKLANAQSITNKTGIVSKEYVIAQNVETIFYIDGVTTAKKIASRPGFANIPAVKNNRIYPIKRDLIIEGAYPVEALNYLVAKLRK